MPHPFTAAERSLLEGAQYGVKSWLELEGPDGRFRELTTFGGIDWVSNLRCRINVDQVTAEAEITLRREAKVPDGTMRSLAPMMEGSALNKRDDGSFAPAVFGGREFRWFISTYALGTDPSAGKKLLFHGVTDSLESGGIGKGQLVLPARDLGARLARASIKDERIYGSRAGVTAEAVLQGILNDNGWGHIKLYTPVSPRWIIDQEFVVEKGKLLPTLQEIASKIGWVCRYWPDSTGAWRLTFFRPRRGNNVPDGALGPTQYTDIPRFEQGLQNVRNYGKVHYFDAVENKWKFEEWRETVSIAAWGEDDIELTEGKDSPIDSPAEAQEFIRTIVQDLAFPAADQGVTIAPLDWRWLPMDLVRFRPNGILYDAPHDFALLQVEHEHGQQKAETRLDTIGRTVGFYRRWLLREGRGTGERTNVVTVSVQRSVGSPSQVTVAATASSEDRDRMAVWYRHGVSVEAQPWARFPATGWQPSPFTAVLSIPRDAGGEMVSVEVYAESEFGHVSDTASLEVKPFLAGEITALSVTVGADGSPLMHIEVAAPTQSVRVAYSIGANPAWPTDAAVRAGVVVPVRDAVDYVPAGVFVGAGEMVRVRAAPYRNADGTGG